MGENMHDILDNVCRLGKLERDQNLQTLEKLLAVEIKRKAGICCQESLKKFLLVKLDDPGIGPDVLHGCLMAAKCALPFLSYDIDFMSKLQDQLMRHLTQCDDVVKIAVGEVVGALCRKAGCQVFADMKDRIFCPIVKNLDDVELSCEKIQENQRAEEINMPSRTCTQSLVIDLKSLSCIIDGCGSSFSSFVNDEFVTIILKALYHYNHNVNEIGFTICSTIYGCHEYRQGYEPDERLETLSSQLCPYLAEGLASVSPQVRLAASAATRHFLLSLSDEARHRYYPLLLPRMCLNRYYIADGVRIYSQETWRQVAGTQGRELVQRYLEPTVSYYEAAITTGNETVREAACACIAELAIKIPQNALSDHVNTLLSTLLVSFNDQSWAVRDASCLACGNFVLSFPQESRCALVDLFPMFYRNLGDPISSVRQGAATALANVVRAYGEEVLPRVLLEVTSALKGVEKQEPTENYCYAESGPIKRPRDQGSTPDSLKAQPWELADGCVHFLGELSGIKEAQIHVLDMMSLVKQSARQRHYSHHVVLLETICKQLPAIGKNVGRKAFSNIVEPFFDEIFYALDCENRLTSSAASQCLNQLATILGQNILRAKVSNCHPRYLIALESVIHVAAF